MRPQAPNFENLDLAPSNYWEFHRPHAYFGEERGRFESIEFRISAPRQFSDRPASSHRAEFSANISNTSWMAVTVSAAQKTCEDGLGVIRLPPRAISGDLLHLSLVQPLSVPPVAVLPHCGHPRGYPRCYRDESIRPKKMPSNQFCTGICGWDLTPVRIPAKALLRWIGSGPTGMATSRLYKRITGCCNAQQGVKGAAIPFLPDRLPNAVSAFNAAMNARSSSGDQLFRVRDPVRFVWGCGSREMVLRAPGETAAKIRRHKSG
ncbi:hypothetical protein B0H14DRAFT_2581137 [Mycena olivaceomarginata]|nr:hypothetical protein B0H14DRAFT_2581137 [Mycena olivaceomarginata]